MPIWVGERPVCIVAVDVSSRQTEPRLATECNSHDLTMRDHKKITFNLNKSSWIQSHIQVIGIGFKSLTFSGFLVRLFFMLT